MLLLILPPAGCATNGRVIEASTSGCEWTRPIYVAEQDVLTDATARQILANNETGHRLCGWKPRIKVGAKLE